MGFHVSNNNTIEYPPTFLPLLTAMHEDVCRSLWFMDMELHVLERTVYTRHRGARVSA